MSFMKDLLIGQEGTPARIEDLRTDNVRGLENDTTNVLRELISGHFGPRLQGDMVAGLSGQEQGLIDFVPELAGRSAPGLEGARSTLERLMGGGAANPLMGIASQPGVQGAMFEDLGSLLSGNATNSLMPGIFSRPGVQDAASRSLGNLLSGRTLDPNSAFINNQVQAATRPIFEAFQDNLGQLTGSATQAGQFVQPGSSSPFEMAKSRLQTGLANAIGDTSANVVTQNVNRERDRQLNFAESVTQNSSRERDRQLDLTGLLGQTFQEGERLALQGANSQVPFVRGQLGGLMDALNISGLPRQITQMGLDKGTEEFDRQQRRLLQVLQLGLQGGRPQTASIPGMEGTSGILGDALTGAASAFGGPIGGALADGAIGLFS